MAQTRTSILDAAMSTIARRGVRGLRVEDVAGEAGVAVSLIYYYFSNRNGLVRATLEHANERATGALLEPAGEGRSGRELVEATLLSEFDDDADLRKTSIVWGEILASAVFEPELREQLRDATVAWVELVADTIRRGIDDGSIEPDVRPDAAASRLTAIVEGLSARWLAGILERDEARALLADAIAVELASREPLT
jgi:AcrR family transcriptional regulator